MLASTPTGTGEERREASADGDAVRVGRDDFDCGRRLVGREEIAEDEVAGVSTNTVEAPDEEARPYVVFSSAGTVSE